MCLQQEERLMQEAEAGWAKVRDMAEDEARRQEELAEEQLETSFCHPFSELSGRRVGALYRLQVSTNSTTIITTLPNRVTLIR